MSSLGFSMWKLPNIKKYQWLIFLVANSQKKIILLQILCFLENNSSQNEKNFIKICNNYPHNGKVLKIWCFHISNVAKFGYIYIWTVITWATSQNWKEKHPYQCNPLFFKEKSCGWGSRYIEPWPRALQIKETNFDIDLMPTKKTNRAKEYLHVENC